jgi:hypothetical protein
MRTSNGLPLLLLYLPFEGEDRQYAPVTQNLGPAAGDPGGCRQHVGYHTSPSGPGCIESDLACHREFIMREELRSREEAERYRGRHIITGEGKGREVIACVIGVFLSSCSEGTSSNMASGRDSKGASGRCQEKFFSLVTYCHHICFILTGECALLSLSTPRRFFALGRAPFATCARVPRWMGHKSVTSQNG